MTSEKCKLYSNKNSTVLVMSPPSTDKCPRTIINKGSIKIKCDYSKIGIRSSKRILAALANL